LLALFLLILVTGVFWGTWFTLTRSNRNVLSRRIHSYRKDNDRKRGVANENPDAGLHLVRDSVGSALPQKNSACFYLNVIASLLIIVALLITVLIEVPIDNQNKNLELCYDSV
jgi:hypothetical protein